MAKDYLPQHVDPIRFADNATQLHGVLHTDQMERLKASLLVQDAPVAVQLEFGIDHQGTKFLKGHVETSLQLQCQRCMEPYNCAIIDDFLLGMVRTEEEAKLLPEKYDPFLLAPDGQLTIADIVEDELILSMPIVPMHDPKECQVNLPFAVSSQGDSELDKDNPFKVIELLKTKRKQK